MITKSIKKINKNNNNKKMMMTKMNRMNNIFGKNQGNGQDLLMKN